MANMGKRTEARFEQGDADGDGDVDGDDFLTWQREIGEATPLSAFAGDSLAESSFSAAAVPEPTTLAVVAAAALFMWLRRQRNTGASYGHSRESGNPDCLCPVAGFPPARE